MYMYIYIYTNIQKHWTIHQRFPLHWLFPVRNLGRDWNLGTVALKLMLKQIWTMNNGNNPKSTSLFFRWSEANPFTDGKLKSQASPTACTPLPGQTSTCKEQGLLWLSFNRTSNAQSPATAHVFGPATVDSSTPSWAGGNPVITG